MFFYSISILRKIFPPSVRKKIENDKYIIFPAIKDCIVSLQKFERKMLKKEIIQL